MTYRKSSASAQNGNCVEVELPAWRQAEACPGGSNCVQWRKATASITEGNCLEVQFHAATASGGGMDCLEVGCGGHEHDEIHVRDSKDQRGPVLRFTHAEWEAFLDGAKKGEFDL